MPTDTIDGVHHDPYDAMLYANPYPMYRRLRDEVPLYYNCCATTSTR